MIWMGLLEPSTPEHAAAIIPAAAGDSPARRRLLLPSPPRAAHPFAVPSPASRAPPRRPRCPLNPPLCGLPPPTSSIRHGAACVPSLSFSQIMIHPIIQLICPSRHRI
ncbi:hypothetical protein DAI22_05g029100 [Oryza sativa Japonica Group]|nr:hypothetical protein DAI22_05g029100 [Oryza sativa Japonica Group]